MSSEVLGELLQILCIQLMGKDVHNPLQVQNVTMESHTNNVEIVYVAQMEHPTPKKEIVDILPLELLAVDQQAK